MLFKRNGLGVGEINNYNIRRNSYVKLWVYTILVISDFLLWNMYLGTNKFYLYNKFKVGGHDGILAV